MKIAVSCESTSDLSKELLQEYDVKIIPYHIVLDGEEFEDGKYKIKKGQLITPFKTIKSKT